MSTTPLEALEGYRQPGEESAQPKEPIEGATVAPETPPAVELTPEQKATQEQARREKVAAKSFKDSARNAIAGRHSNARQQAADDFRKENASEAQSLEQIAGAPSADLLARLEAEASGETPPTPQPAKAPEPVAQQLNPIASQNRAYKIRYYGQERDATEEEVVQAGIAALQKQHAGDARLQDAATYEAQLRDWETQLRSYAETLRTTGAQGGARESTGGSTTPQPPDTGAAGQEVNDLRLKAAQALLQGDDTKYAELSAKADQLFFDAVTKATGSVKPTQSSEQGAVPELPARSNREPWKTEDRVAINKVFERDFADLLANDVAYENARTLMEEELANVHNFGRDPTHLAREVGFAVKQLMKQSAAPQPQSTASTQQSLEQRRTLKAQIPLTPPAGSGRSELGSPVPPNRQQANKAYVQLLRRRSGSNSSGV